jgi:uncharacterized membrane protein YbhN (UPF0104 family)
MGLTSARIATKACGFLSNAALSRLLKYALTIVILIVAARYVHAGKLLSTISTMRPVALFFATLLLIPNLGLQYVKWLRLLRQLDPHIQPTEVWHSLLAGYPLGLITPGRWGEIGRGFFLANYPSVTIAALAAIDKITNFVCIVILGGIGAAILMPSGLLLNFPAPIFLPLAILLIAFLIAIFTLPSIKKFLLRKLGRGNSPFEFMQRFKAKLMAKLSALSFFFVLTFSAQFVILVSGLHPVPIGDGLAAALSTFFIQSMLPVSIGDLGVRESAAAFFFGKLGVAPHLAFDAGLMLFIINMLMPSALGLLLIWKKKSKPRCS